MVKRSRQLLAGPYIVWIIGFIILPVLMILYYAFTDLAPPFTFSNLAAIAQPIHLKSLLMALKLGILSTLICLVLSYPLAMILMDCISRSTALLCLFLYFLCG